MSPLHILGIFGRRPLQAGLDAPRLSAVIGRVLIALIGLLLVVMPWTERVYTWDNGFRGGQDCEFGLLAFAAVLCLVLLLPQWSNRLLLLYLTTCRLLWLVFGLACGAGKAWLCGFVISGRLKRAIGAALEQGSFPLLI